MLSILYLDDYLASVNKPAGLLVHRTGLDAGETRFALQMLRDQLGRPVWPLHRLDKGTSGVLLFALDAATARMVNRPESLDTLVATNLHADILSHLAAALGGSLGIAPTGNIDPERRYPSMFEPIHGSAFDIMGQGLANPIGTFWSCVMLLEHLGEVQAASTLMAAIEQATANPALHTRDLGGQASTEQVTRAVCASIQ